jgi:hypothetical protein
MKIKTSELTGAALDWAVAKAEGRTDVRVDEDGELVGQDDFDYSTDWSQAGPIIEREGLLIRPQPGKEAWDAWKHGADEPHYTVGPTPLIAAMRCFVASKLGDEVDVPEELV